MHLIIRCEQLECECLLERFEIIAKKSEGPMSKIVKRNAAHSSAFFSNDKSSLITPLKTYANNMLCCCGENVEKLETYDQGQRLYQGSYSLDLIRLFGPFHLLFVTKRII